MSTLLLNTLTGKTSAGSIVVTGEGGSTTTNIQQGLVKAWVNLDGDSTASIVDNLNVGSLTDNGTGNFTVTYTNNMGNATYAVVLGIDEASNSGGTLTIGNVHTTSQLKLLSRNSSASLADENSLNAAILGDLA
jgi:hypothetical protein